MHANTSYRDINIETRRGNRKQKKKIIIDRINIRFIRRAMTFHMTINLHLVSRYKTFYLSTKHYLGATQTDPIHCLFFFPKRYLSKKVSRVDEFPNGSGIRYYAFTSRNFLTNHRQKSWIVSQAI